ncbi:hypothetical protein AURDEDRAFT_159772 [Auricularia subglabra TFB-10046 SS5]|nr:hypothetical protein AURDEDRAFT_159772 [Auricularia subglabra TFB-10046 SS5]
MQVDEFANNATWAEFHASVLKLYPENGTIKEYTLEELKERIAKWKEAGVFKSQDAVSRYMREFLACQKSLQRQGVVHQKQELYLSAFSKGECEHIERRLEWKHPDQHYRDLDIDNIMEDVRFLAKNSNSETTGATAKYAYSPLGLDPREVSASAPQTVKREPTEERLMASIAHLLDEKLDARLSNRTAMPPLSHAPATAGGFQGTRFGTTRQGNDPVTRMGHDRCLFCDDSGHLMKQCPVRFEYLQSGKVVEDMLPLSKARHFSG